MLFNNRAGAADAAGEHVRATRRGRLQQQLAARGRACTHRGRFAPDALIVEDGHPLRGPRRERGWFVVQDEASQLVTLLAGERPGPRVLDTCASPGGKDDGPCRRDTRRRDWSSRATCATGAWTAPPDGHGRPAPTNVRLVQADLLAALPFAQRVRLVLVDAPCSGLGTLRRDPDIRWRRHEADLPALAAAQRADAAPRGRRRRAGRPSVYATCSSEPEENEHVVDAFLARRIRDFAPVDARHRRIRALPPDPSMRAGICERSPIATASKRFFGAVFERRVCGPQVRATGEPVGSHYCL